MRASVLVLGPLLARTGHARVSLPGGCAIGARPINLHIKGFENLGATDTNRIRLRRSQCASGSMGAEYRLRQNYGHRHGKSDDGGHAGRRDARYSKMPRCEPEVTDLAELLNKMGAKISGAGTSTITIEGVPELHGATHRIIPDRIEAGTFLAAGAMTEWRSGPARLQPSASRQRD